MVNWHLPCIGACSNDVIPWHLPQCISYVPCTACRSTLLFQQIKYSCIAAATQAALRNLIAAKLITVQADPETPQQQQVLSRGGGGGRHPAAAAAHTGKVAASASQLVPAKQSRFVTTQMGRAVYDSALPTHTAMELYRR